MNHSIGLNPYFIGLSTLIYDDETGEFTKYLVSILILLDYLLLLTEKLQEEKDKKSLNPYFIGLSTLIIE